MNKFASVSVVIPCYRCADTIGRAVESVYKQTLKPYEVILVDDYSNDETLEVLYSLQSKYGDDWIKVFSLQENDGPATARNIGWNYSNQDFIAFLDADDSWASCKIELQYNWMRKNPWVVLTGHGSSIIDNQGASLSKSLDVSFFRVSKLKLLLTNCFPTRSVMVKRTIKQRFPKSQRHSEDYQLWLSIICSGLDCYKSESVLAYSYKRDFGDSGLSSNLLKMQIGELNNFRMILKNGCISVLTYLFVIFFSSSKFLKRFLFIKYRNFLE